MAAVLIGVGLLVRIGLFVATRPHPDRRGYFPDSLDYERLAQNLAAGHGFSLDAAPPYRPDVLRTPLYPALLAVVELLGGTPLTAGVALGVLLSCASVALARVAARAWLPGGRTGDVAAILVALDLGGAAYANFLLTESLFVFLLLGAFAVLGRAVRRAGFRDALLAGALLGCASLCRPIALGLPIALSIGRRKTTAAGLLGGAALVLVPWIARNAVAADYWNVSSVGEVNLRHHRGEAILDDRRGVKHDAPARIAGASDPRELQRMWKEGRRVILENPAAFVRLTLFAWLRTFGPDEDPFFRLLGIPWERGPWWLSRGKSQEPRGLAAAENLSEAALLLVIYAAAARGWRGWRDPARRPMLLSAGAVVIYFLLVSGPEYYGRFRVPILPFFALMAEAAPQKMRGRLDGPNR